MRILLPKRAHGDIGVLVQLISLAGDIHLMYIHRGVAMEMVVPDYSDEEITVTDSVNRELETFGNLFLDEKCFLFVSYLQNKKGGDLVFCFCMYRYCDFYSSDIDLFKGILTGTLLKWSSTKINKIKLKQVN